MQVSQLGWYMDYSTLEEILLACFLPSFCTCLRTCLLAHLRRWDPSSIVVEDTFFLATHAVLHASHEGRGKVDGHVVRYM